MWLCFSETVWFSLGAVHLWRHSLHHLYLVMENMPFQMAIEGCYSMRYWIQKIIEIDENPFNSGLLLHLYDSVKYPNVSFVWIDGSYNKDEIRIIKKFNKDEGSRCPLVWDRMKIHYIFANCFSHLSGTMTPYEGITSIRARLLDSHNLN